jgi:hypothetical protein
VGDEAAENVLAVLPDGLHDDDGRVFGNLAKDAQAVALAIDEAVAFGGVEGMAPADGRRLRGGWRP